jgi:membrane protease YdiL (CAAX protease family)
MPDEPIQPEPPSAPPIVVKVEPTNPLGWIVTGLLLALFIAGAVGGYIKQFGAEPSASMLEENLRYNVHLAADSSSPIGSLSKQGLNDVYEEATAKAGASEDAARVALVASRELDKEAPGVALENLADSDDPVSRQFAEIYGGEVVTEELVKEFEENGEEGFTVELARVQAREMLDMPSGREELVDKSFVPKLVGAMMGGGLLGLLGFIGLIYFLVLHSQGRLTPVGMVASRSDGDRLVLRFGLYLILFAIAGLASTSLEEIEPFKHISSIWLSGGVLLFVLLASVGMLYLPLFGKSDRLATVLGDTTQFGRKVGIGLYGYLCTLPIIAIVLVLVGIASKFLPEPSHPISEDIASASGLDWLAIFLTAAVLAPLLEEITFRGMLFPALATRLRPIVAVVVSGLLFAAIHPQGPLVWPALATTGGVAAYLRYYSGSLIPSIVLHMVHNGLIFAFSIVVT